jgi:hypothetical protein
MRLRLSEPAAVPDLVEFLLRRVDVVAGQAGENKIEVSLLGSWRSPFDEIELESRLQPWRDAHPGVSVEAEPTGRAHS